MGNRHAGKKKWIDWFDSRQPDEQRAIAVAAIERLIEIEEVFFREADKHDPSSDTGLYWGDMGDFD